MDRRTLLHGLAAAGTTGLMGAVAGCASSGDGNGGGGNGDGATTAGGETTGGGTTAETTPTDGTNDQTPPIVTVSSVEPFGEILTGHRGVTLYLSTKDKPGKSVCYGECEVTWPTLLTDGEPTAGEDVIADLGTITRKTGFKQVTAAGHPLYYYTPDEQPGDTKGQGIGGVWFVVAPDGSKITGAGTGTGSETGTGTDSSGGGGGRNY